MCLKSAHIEVCRVTDLNQFIQACKHHHHSSWSKQPPHAFAVEYWVHVNVLTMGYICWVSSIEICVLQKYLQKDPSENSQIHLDPYLHQNSKVSSPEPEPHPFTTSHQKWIERFLSNPAFLHQSSTKMAKPWWWSLYIPNAVTAGWHITQQQRPFTTWMVNNETGLY